jgi:hypothetical protein
MKNNFRVSPEPAVYLKVARLEAALRRSKNENIY